MRHQAESARGALTRAILASIVVAMVALAAWLPSGVAAAQPAATRVRRMTNQAMWAYQHLEIQRAQRLLDHALAYAQRTRVRGRTLAELHMARGVVAAGGFGDAAAAESAFVEALFSDPGIELDRMLSNPSIARAFEAARQATGADEDSPVDPEAVAQALPEPESPAPEAPAPVVIDEARPARGPRFFVRAGYAIGTAMARRGGIADRGVPFHPANRPADWDEATDGVYAPPGYASEAEWYAAIATQYQGFTENPANPYALPVPVTVDGTTVSEGPLRPDDDCEADRGELCVRLQHEGLVLLSGLDVEVGYWVTPTFAVSLGMRLGLPAGQGTLARVLLTGRIEVPFTRISGRGVRALATAGVGMGQIQLPIPQGQGLVEPFIATGLGNLNGGLVLGFAFTDNVGLFARPTVHAMFPRQQLVYELAIGAEASF